MGAEREGAGVGVGTLLGGTFVLTCQCGRGITFPLFEPVRKECPCLPPGRRIYDWDGAGFQVKTRTHRYCLNESLEPITQYVEEWHTSRCAEGCTEHEIILEPWH